MDQSGAGGGQRGHRGQRQQRCDAILPAHSGRGKLRFGLGSSVLNGTATLPLNTWTLVGATYDGSQMKLFVNGNVDGSVARTGTMSNNGINVRIGGRQFTTPLTFNGRMDGIWLYSRALTQVEIQAILTSTASNAPPTATLTAPANNSVFTAPANITLGATASDSDGTVTKVEFFDSASLLATVVSAPYTFVWNNVPVGTHTLTARATDNFYAVGTSTAGRHSQRASKRAALVSLTSPANNAVFTAPVNVTPHGGQRWHHRKSGIFRRCGVARHRDLPRLTLLPGTTPPSARTRSRPGLPTSEARPEPPLLSTFP